MIIRLIPSSCEALEHCALDGRIDNAFAPGPISIYFEPNAQIKRFENAAIANFLKVNIFIYDKVYPSQTTYLFGGTRKLKIFSPHSYHFCGKKTITIYTGNKNIRKCHTFSTSIFLCILLIS